MPPQQSQAPLATVIPPSLSPPPLRNLLSLPDELLVQIVSYLAPCSAIPLHSTCRRLRGFTRQDPALWRSLGAYQDTADHAPHAREWPVPGIKDGDRIDWYNEYKFRYAPLRTRWFSAGEGEGGEVKGVTVFDSSGGGDGGGGKIAASLADGSVCVWSLAERRMLGRSSAGLVFGAGGEWGARRKAREAEIVDGVSVNGVCGKMWVAGEEGLIEIDLNTLQKVSTHRFLFSITTLSQTSHPHPLTVGTTQTLHLHDPRVSVPASTVVFAGSGGTPDERVQPILPSSYPFLKNYHVHAHLFQPCPLSILHLDSSASDSPADASIHVAGRFSSIITYSRRMWPKLRGTLHSGGRICSLATIPHYPNPIFPPLGPVEATLPAVEQDGPTLLAAGEYKGRGTLEVYPLGAPDSDGVVRNRQTASRSKILSVAAHGARIMFGDSDGVVKWVERDGRRVVRSYAVEGPERRDKIKGDGLWGSAANSGGGEVVRKVVAPSQAGEEVVVWSGDRVGVIGTFAEGGEEMGEEIVDEEKRERERVYLERMRAALERQAEEVRIMAGLGY